jgi:hypothetical protein
LGNGSRVNREIYARFCGEAQGEIPWAYSPTLTLTVFGPKLVKFRVADHSIARDQLYASYAMNVRWKRSFSVVFVMASVAWGQNAIETGLYLSFNKNGPIAIGKIESIRLERQSPSWESGTLSLAVTQQLRGEPLPSRFEIRFIWADPNSPANAMSRAKMPPSYGFERIRPVLGMNVLIIFNRHKPIEVRPLAVLNLDSGEGAWVPLIERAIGFSSLKGSDRLDALLHGLDDPQEFIRVVSMHQLRESPECQSGSACADGIVNLLSGRANKGTPQERAKAISWLDYDVYDATAGPTSTNNKIAAITLALVADTDPSIRRQAIESVDQMVSPERKWRPDLSHLDIPNRGAVIESLRQAHKQGEEAERVSSALGVER